jgi:hypothetical protein
MGVKTGEEVNQDIDDKLHEAWKVAMEAKIQSTLALEKIVEVIALRSKEKKDQKSSLQKEKTE